MQALSERQVAVIGGSAQTWAYGRWMRPQSMNQYDTNAKAMCDMFRCMNVCAVTGADELKGIYLAGSIGHVQADAMHERIVFDACHTWLTICTWTPSFGSNKTETQTPETPLQPLQPSVVSSTSTSPSLPPPPPPPSRFVEPWAAVYCNTYQAYYYDCTTAPMETRTWEAPPRHNEVTSIAGSRPC